MSGRRRSSSSSSSFVLLLAVVVLAAVAPTTTTATRVSLPFDYGWRWHMGHVTNGSQPVCPPSTFPTNMTGTRCNGLQHFDAGDASPTACTNACCDAPDCLIWQWKDPAQQGGGCWAGASTDCESDKTWQGAGRAQPGPSPAPPAAGAKFSLDDSGWPVVTTPHDFIYTQNFDNGSDPGIGRSYLPRNVSWYRKHFALPPSFEGQSIYLYFEGVFRYADIYVNEQYLGHHGDGYTSFSVRIDNVPGGLHYGESPANLLAVYVDALTGSGWWMEGGGIYRPVHLIATAPAHMEQNGIATYTNVTAAIVDHDASRPQAGQSTASATVHIRADLVNTDLHASAQVQLQASVADTSGSGGVVGSAVSGSYTLGPNGTATARLEVPVTNIELWTIARPYLYTLGLRLVAASDGAELDSRNLSIGVHVDVFDPERGYFINGKHAKLRGFCDHNNFAGVGMAMTPRIHLFATQGIRGLGGVARRFSHNPATPVTLDIYDRLGVVAMDENRLFDNNTDYLHAMGEMVKRDRNHASVIVWSFCNEVGCEGSHETGGPSFNQLTYQLDGSRPTLANMFSYGDLLSNNTDIQGFSHRDDKLYEQFHSLFPHRPSWGSECCSCTTMRGEDVANNTAYALSNMNADCLVTQTNWTQSRDYVIGQMIWTSRDYAGEPSFSGWPHKSSSFGSYDLSGFSKAAAHWYRAWWLADVPRASWDRVPAGPDAETYIVQQWVPSSSSAADTTAVQPCCANKCEAQGFAFSGNGPIELSGKKLCVDATCTNKTAGCYPLPLVACSGGADQVFQAKNGAIVAAANGMCLDVYGASGPSVGLYACNGNDNQKWTAVDGTLQVASGGCLSDPAGVKSMDVYTNGASVSVLVNGQTLVTRQPVPFYQWTTVTVDYAPGNITAISYNSSGAEMGRFSRFTPGAPVAVRLSVDSPNEATGTGSALMLDGIDTGLLRAEIVDSAGRVVPGAAINVTFTIVSGPGRIVGTDNGDPRCHEKPQGTSWRTTYHGLARAVLQTTQVAVGSLDYRKLLMRVNDGVGAAGVGGDSTVFNLDPAPAAEPIVVVASAVGLQSSAQVSIKTSVDDSDSVLAVAARSVNKIYQL